MDIAQGGTPQPHGGRHVREAAVDQHDIGGIYGDVGPGTDCHAEIGAGQGGRVVDAVADHGDLAPARQIPHDLFLAVRQNAGDDVCLIQSRLSADSAGCACSIAGQHDHLQSHVAQGTDGGGALGLDFVSHTDDAQETPAAREEQRRFSLVRQRLGACGAVRPFGWRQRVTQPVPHECEIAAEQQLAIGGGGGQPVPRQGTEIHRRGRVQPPARGFLAYGAGERMLAAALQRQRSSQELLLAHVERQDIHDAGGALGDGSGLVQNDCPDSAGFLQRGGGLEQDPAPRPDAAADHDGDRGCQSQCAGAADDQHGDAACQCEADILPDQHPHKECDK